MSTYAVDATPAELGSVVLRGVRPLGNAPADVVITEGRITSIESVGSAEEQLPSFPAEGLVLLPGLVDLHTHLREPGAPEAETVASGTRAAAAGGYTDVFAMANTDPVTDTAERVATLTNLAKSAACRVHPVAAITKGLAGEELSPLPELAEHGVRMFSDDGKCVDDAGLLRAALAAAARYGVVIAQHAQHGQLADRGQINAGHAATSTGLAPWPASAEETIVARDAILAGETGSKLHVCHVSTKGTVEVVRWAKKQGWPVSAEVTPHHLLLTDELAAMLDTRYKVNPPLRSASDVAALREALVDGTIDAVATDHAPHTAERKRQPWCAAPFGMTGVETALPVLVHVLTELDMLDWGRVAELMSVGPARIGGLSSARNAPLEVGGPATFCLVDPHAYEQVIPSDHHSKSSNSPFRDLWLPARVVATVAEGRITHGALRAD